eukprot:scaffold661539_cov62-Prasinocladus_malaysianus.AAC.1
MQDGSRQAQSIHFWTLDDIAEITCRLYHNQTDGQDKKGERGKALYRNKIQFPGLYWNGMEKNRIE